MSGEPLGSTSVVAAGVDTCPVDGATLGEKSRAHITRAVRYHVRRCPECNVDYYVAQPGPSGMTVQYMHTTPPEVIPAGDEYIDVAVLHFQPALITQAIGLIDLDRRLAQDEGAGVSGLDEMQEHSSEQWNEYADKILLSYLWVLGAYEVIRALAQRLLGDAAVPLDCREQLENAKRLFERVRIPLAKGEAASRYAKTDRPFAFPTSVSSVGIGWPVNEELTITRRELSQAFRGVLRCLRDASGEVKTT